MKCPQCGKEVPKDIFYCPIDGTSLQQQYQQGVLQQPQLKQQQQHKTLKSFFAIVLLLGILLFGYQIFAADTKEPLEPSSIPPAHTPTPTNNANAPTPGSTVFSSQKAGTVNCELCHPTVRENKSHPLIDGKLCSDCHGTDIGTIHRNSLGFAASPVPIPIATASPGQTISLARKTLMTGEIWNMGEGYTLSVNSIDAKANPRQVWLVLSRNGNKLDDKVLNSGDEYKYFTKTNNNIFGTKIYGIYPGATADMVILTDTYIVSGYIP